MKNKTKKPVSRNITRSKERVRLEGLVRQQAAELKVKNGQLRNGVYKQTRSEEQIHIRTKAMESTADGIFIIDARKPNLPFVYVNQSFKKMTGYVKREILGRDYLLFYGVVADSHIANEIKQAILKGKSFHGDILNSRKDGKKVWNSLRLAPVRDSNGIVTHYVGIKTDITLMREKELKIDEQREELLHVTRVGKLAEFVSSLAHEISQPLTAILSYAQAAQRMLAGREPEIQKILSYIINDDQRSTGVIQRLRSLLKRSVSESKPLDINVLINEVIKLIATDATVRNSMIKTELDTNLPFVRGDRIQLQQVLLNLISNSFDAMEDSLGSHEILIRTSRKDNHTIMVEVKDSGCGIPAQNMPKLFTHFFTSKPDGLGMGLSISRSIVEAHGGRLDVNNNPDRGATFYFTIPIDIKDA
jgi:PAS domain S-box-containing protein